MTSTPIVSVVMKIKNGMPYLPQALASLANQTFRDFELVVQDGGSTDNSLAVLEQQARQLTQNTSIESGKDAGTADAFNKAIRRCRGRIIGSLDCDNLLEPDALEKVVRTFGEAPDSIAIYGAQKMIWADGTFAHYYHPAAFSVLDFLECRLVPPFGSSFFNVASSRDYLITDASLKTCEDFAIWLHCLEKRITMMPDVLVSTRMSPASMTFRPQTYEQFCRDKIASLQSYFDGLPSSAVNDALRRRAIAGVYVWAAESLCFFFPSDLGKASHHNFLERARETDPASPRLAEFEAHLARAAANKPKGIRGIIRKLREGISAATAKRSPRTP